MVVYLSLLIAVSLLRTVKSGCRNATFNNGIIANYRDDMAAGDAAKVMCADGYATYNPFITCGDSSAWEPSPICHKVNVRFNDTSMIKYVYPIPYDSVDSTVSFSFSVPPDQSSGILVRLASKKLADGSKDTLTIELVGGFIATTMQLSSLGQSIIAFCHDDMPLNDGSVHSVVLNRDMASLAMTIDGRTVECTYPSGSSTSFTFSSLRSVIVGHLQPTWGPEYGLTGCMTDLAIDGLAPLVLADIHLNTVDKVDHFTAVDLTFVESCGVQYVVPSTEATPQSTRSPPLTGPSEAAVGRENGDDDEADKTTLIIILVTIFILILVVLLIGVVCKKYYSNKGTYKVENQAGQENQEQEYFI